MLRVFEKMTVL